MEGISLVETKVLESLINKIDHLEQVFDQTVKELKTATKPWMNSKEVGEYLGKGSTWVDANKAKIGFSKAGGEIRFRRKDVEAYLEASYFKTQWK